MSIEVHAIGLTEEEAIALEKLFNANDEAGVERVMSKITAIHALKQETARLKARVTEETMLNVHFLLHEKRIEESMMLLCPLAAMIEGDTPPMEVINAAREKMRQISMEREKSECGGNA